MPSASTTATVVVATYGRHHLLAGALASLLDQEFDRSSFEILVIDNSPDPSAASAFARRYEGISHLRCLLESTPGVSNARNRGAQEGTGRLVAFMDDDAIASPRWLKQLVTTFEQGGAKVGVVGGRVVPQWLSPRPAWLHDDLLGYLTIVDRGVETREIGDDEWLAACNLAFDREALLAIGGFSQGLGRVGNGMALLSNEEIDACARMRRAGNRVLYSPHAVVEHIIDPARLTKSWFRRRVAWQAVSDYLMNPAAADEMARSTSALLLEDTSGDEANDFRTEMGKIYARTIRLLCGEPE
jgi:glycosyltransferase involved in cell wall biosynthesis